MRRFISLMIFVFFLCSNVSIVKADIFDNMLTDDYILPSELIDKFELDLENKDVEVDGSPVGDILVDSDDFYLDDNDFLHDSHLMIAPASLTGGVLTVTMAYKLLSGIIATYGTYSLVKQGLIDKEYSLPAKDKFAYGDAKAAVDRYFEREYNKTYLQVSTVLSNQQILDALGMDHDQAMDYAQDIYDNMEVAEKDKFDDALDYRVQLSKAHSDKIKPAIEKVYNMVVADRYKSLDITDLAILRDDGYSIHSFLNKGYGVANKPIDIYLLSYYIQLLATNNINNFIFIDYLDARPSAYTYFSSDVGIRNSPFFYFNAYTGTEKLGYLFVAGVDDYAFESSIFYDVDRYGLVKLRKYVSVSDLFLMGDDIASQKQSIFKSKFFTVEDTISYFADLSKPYTRYTFDVDKVNDMVIPMENPVFPLVENLPLNIPYDISADVAGSPQSLKEYLERVFPSDFEILKDLLYAKDVPLDGVKVPEIDVPDEGDKDINIPILSDLLDWLKKIWEMIRDFFDYFVRPATSTIDLSPFYELSIVDRFPFCLPFDLYHAFASFIAPSAVPEFNVVFDKGLVGAGTFVFSFEPFKEIVVILRYFLLLGFVVNLIKLTRKILG